MSAENTTDTKSSRRRRRMAEAEEQVKNQTAQDVDDDVDESDDDDESDETTTRGITAKKGRPTPGRRNRVEDEEEGNTVTRTVGGLRGYIQDTREELIKVTWPTREETIRLTVIVLVVTVISAVVLGFISLVFTELVRYGIANPFALMIMFAVFVAAILGFLFYTTRNSGNTNSY